MDMQSRIQRKRNESALPFIPECETIREGGPGQDALMKDCQKNPGHKHFLSVAELKLEHLPSDWQEPEYLDAIRRHCDMTVKVIVNCTSSNRPDTWPGTDKPYPYGESKGSRFMRVGTGFILRAKIKYGPCPCQVCENTVSQLVNEYMDVKVLTATHVVYDNVEAAKTTCECFYDSEDRTDVKCLHGVRVSTRATEEVTLCLNDSCLIQCVTHDEELMKKLGEVIENHDKHNNVFLRPHLFMASHPHGMSKRLALGTLCYRTVKSDDEFSIGESYELKRICNTYDSSDPIKLSCRLTDSSLPSTHRLTSDSAQLSDLPSSQSDNECYIITNDGEEFNKSCVNLTPGIEYRVPETTTFTLRQDAGYLYRLRTEGKDKWLTFPSGTLLTLPDGRFLPRETELKSLDPVNQGLWARDHSVSYDIPTCPGSSGALIVDDRNAFDRGPLFYCYSFNHGGAGHDGTNISSYGAMVHY